MGTWNMQHATLCAGFKRGVVVKGFVGWLEKFNILEVCSSSFFTLRSINCHLNLVANYPTKSLVEVQSLV